MSDKFDPVAAAAAMRNKIVDEAPRLYAENERLAARVRELEAERGTLRADNERLRALLTPVPSFLIALAERITHPCPLKDTTVNTRRAIEAALAKGKV